MSRRQEFCLIVHGGNRLGFFPMQVALVLHADCVGAIAYVGEDGAFHPPPAWHFLPTPLQVELVFDDQFVSKDFLLQFGFQAQN